MHIKQPHVHGSDTNQVQPLSDNDPTPSLLPHLKVTRLYMYM